MPFDIKNLNPPERFYYPDSEEWVEFVSVSQDVLESINELTVEKKVEHVNPTNKNGKPDKRRPLQRIEYDKIDETRRDDLIAERSIYAWHLVDNDGNEIPCTDSKYSEDGELVEMGTKTTILRGHVAFNVWMAECLETMNEAKLRLDKDKEKN